MTHTVASSANEWLASVGEEPVMAPPLLIHINLLAFNMGITNLNEDTPLSIPEGGALVCLALRVFDDGGTSLLHDVIEVGVVQGT